RRSVLWFVTASDCDDDAPASSVTASPWSGPVDEPGAGVAVKAPAAIAGAFEPAAAVGARAVLGVAPLAGGAQHTKTASAPVRSATTRRFMFRGARRWRERRTSTSD